MSIKQARGNETNDPGPNKASRNEEENDSSDTKEESDGRSDARSDRNIRALYVHKPLGKRQDKSDK